MKKVLKIVGIGLLILGVVLVVVPYLFQEAIENKVKEKINSQLDADINWEKTNLSLLSSFPDVRIKLKNASLVNREPFRGDTLLFAQSISLSTGLSQLWKSKDAPLQVKDFVLKKAVVNLLINKEGKANYDIVKNKGEPEKRKSEGDSESQKEDSDFKLALKHYRIEDSRISYADENVQLSFKTEHLNHSGSGDLSAQTTTLKTKTDLRISVKKDSITYLAGTRLKLDADLNMDFAQNKYTFEKNKLLINQLPLTFDGWIRLNETRKELDLSFETPNSDFKNLLALLPENFVKNLDRIQTEGQFTVKGSLAGVMDDNHFPKTDIRLIAQNGSFKYPELPQNVSDIALDVQLSNITGKPSDLNLDLNHLNFRIGEDAFQAKGNFKDLQGEMPVNLSMKGRLNLAKIREVYPIESKTDLNGILDLDLAAHFVTEEVSQQRYENVKSGGTLSLVGMKTTPEGFDNPVEIKKAEIRFDSEKAILKELGMTTGQSDLSLSGILENYMSFLFKNQPIKGRFDMISDNFYVADFMTGETSPDKKEKTENSNSSKTKNSSDEEVVKIPSFLDMTVHFKAHKIVYDKTMLTDAAGTAVIREQTLYLKNINADVFGGRIGLTARVSTLNETPDYSANFNLNSVDFDQSIEGIPLLSKLAPVAKAFKGKLSAEIDLKGLMNKDFTPKLASLDGQGGATIEKAVIEKTKLPLVENLNNKLGFFEAGDIDLTDKTTRFSFKDGAVDFKPTSFTIHKDIKAVIKGRHSFDNQMDYQLDLDLPAKYLGTEVGTQLSKLSDADLENIRIDLPVHFTGSLASPKTDIDFKKATKSLTSQIAGEQKNKAKDKIKNKLTDLLKDEPDNSSKTSDSTETDDKKKLKDKAKSKLNRILGKDKKQDR